jgi:hypothetical protein
MSWSQQPSAEWRVFVLEMSMEYLEYLQTDHWKKLAAKVKRKAGNKCQVCNASGELHAHHRTYERKGNEAPGDVIALCSDCHKLFHGKGEPGATMIILDSESLLGEDKCLIPFSDLRELERINEEIMSTHERTLSPEHEHINVALNLSAIPGKRLILFDNLLDAMEWIAGMKFIKADMQDNPKRE